MVDTLWLVPHFHYDPVWWNTQAGYTQTWDERRLSGARFAWPGHSAFTLVKAHLAKACKDPGYRFVLAEVDYLKPYWDTYPEDRALIRRLIRDGRLELVGGTYNEPNTNLTGVEPTIRNAVHGVRFQRNILGGAPETAWQLDVFGHDPQFPQVMSGAGLTSTAFARGPYHQWGPMLTSWNIREHRKPFAPTQFPTEFEWVAPSGDGLLTHYMAAHYAAGFSLDTAQTPRAAADDLHELFTVLRPAAATGNVMIPMGSDFTPPMRWITELRSAWRERYPHVQLRCGLPRDFFAAVRAGFAARGVRPTPQTRDMNPVYTGKDVTAIDTKQIHRLVESLLLDAEKWATFATLHGARHPAAALDKAWRLLLFGAHHDAVTGTQSDQVYLDLLAGWREAHDLASHVDGAARRHLARHVDTGGAGIPVVVFNPLAFPRTDVVSAEVDAAAGFTLVDESGTPVPYLAETETLIRWVAHDVPSLGYRTYRLVPGDARPAAWQPARPAAWQPARPAAWQPARPAAWQPVGGTSIANDRYRLTADPARGGALTEITDLAGGRDLLPPGRVANELVCVDEHRDHPEFGEGPWHLLPAGIRWRGGDVAATVTVERSPIGERVTASAVVDGCRYTQHITLWYGLDRIDFATRIDEFTGTDQLLRVRVPCRVPGGMPVSETAAAVIGRGYALLDADAAVHPWTLDNTAHRWFGLGAALTVHLHDLHGRPERSRAVSIAEIVVPDGDEGDDGTRRLAVALVHAGVTATVTPAAGNRYGSLDTDSNLPDCRVAVGTPQRNGFVAGLFAGTPPNFRAELDAQLAATGTARLWVPAARPLGAAWRPGADLRGTRDLPVLVVAGTDPQTEDRAVAELIDDLADARVHVTQPAALHRAETTVDDYAVALVNRGTPGFAIEPDGTLNMSLARACTGWPTGTAIDFPDHKAPGGRSFQHPTSRRFEYALVSGPGGWRAAGFTGAGQAVNHPLAATVVPAGGGRLPATGSFLTVEPARSLAVTAVTPADGGTPGLIVRGYEPHGRSGRATVRLTGGVVSATATDLIGRPGAELYHDGHAVEIATRPYTITSLTLRPARLEPGTAPLHPDTEPVQPVFTRYWLHNSGPAPMGDLPVTVTLRPDDSTSHLYAQIASSLPDNRTVDLRIRPPERWLASPESKHVTVPAEGYTTVAVTVSPPDGAAPGWYAISATIDDRDQELRDVLLVPVGDAVAEPLLGARSEPGQLVLAPGGRGRIAVQVSHALRTPIEGYVQLITPHHGWPLTGDPVRAFTARPGCCARIEFPVTVPAGFPPGEFWAKPKVCAYGQIAYAEPVRIRISAG